MTTKRPRILFFDIETSPLQAWVWQCGKQYVNHKQLVKGHNRYGIICVAYAWNDGSPVQSIDWGYHEQDTKKVIEEFDKIASMADQVIGKNSDRFDIKMINACRMLYGVKGNPTWGRYADDLEKQMRKQFRLPSQSLDYISSQLGYGGKVKMEFQDWVDIMEKNSNGLVAFNKMIHYNKKDTTDTRDLWYRISEHFDPKFNMSTYNDGAMVCKHENCGSNRIYKNGTKTHGGSRYQEYLCGDCGRYAGRTRISATKEGKLL